MASVPGSSLEDAFTDSNLNTLSILPSGTGSERVTKTHEVEIGTDEQYFYDVEIQPDKEVYDAEIQTESGPGKDQAEGEVDYEYLGNWLESIYPMVANVLEQNATSKAFDLYEMRKDDDQESNI